MDERISLLLVSACNTYSEATDVPFESILSKVGIVYDREIPTLFGNAPETHRRLYEEVTRGLFAGRILDAAHIIIGNRRRNPNYKPEITLEEDLSHFLNEAAEEAEDNLPTAMIAHYNRKVTVS